MGVYNVSWTGKGSVGFASDVNGVKTTILATQPQSLLVKLEPSLGTGQAGLQLRLLRSNGTNPVTRISMIPAELTHPSKMHTPTQMFHPEFLQLFSGYDHVRLTQWSRLIGSSGKTWAARTLPSSVSQLGSDGVALEHMLDLVRETRVSSAWLSLPTLSDDYNTQALALFAQSLSQMVRDLRAQAAPTLAPTASPAGAQSLSSPAQRSPLLTAPFKLYIESGSAESHGNTDRAASSLTLFAAARTAFQGLDAYVVVVPSTSVYYMSYVSYVMNWFGASFSALKAIAVNAQFGRSNEFGLHYDSLNTWDLTWANYTVPQVMKEIRNSVLHADKILNDARQRLLSRGTSFEFVAWTGGPHFTAQPYNYRYALNIIKNCLTKNTFPCAWGSINVANATMANQTLPALSVNATLEQRVEDLLIAAQRSNDLYEIYLDFMRRWDALGGSLFVGNTLLKTHRRCLSGAAECGNNGVFEEQRVFARCAASVADPLRNYSASALAARRAGAAPCHKHWAPLDYKRGVRSALAYTAAEMPQDAPPVCSAGCVWGTCDYPGRCVCFAGYGGADCSQLSADRANTCTNDTGINLSGIADWSSEQPFLDVFLAGRAWITQDFVGGPWSTNTPLALRRDGYPANLTDNQKVGSLLLRDLRGHVKRGVYVVLYDGDGVLTFSMDVTTVYRSVGRIEINVQPTTGLNNGIFVMIERTNPLDPVRNIRVVVPGYERSFSRFPFHPVFLRNMRPFKILRFMEWMQTNVVGIADWADRPQLNVNTRGFSGGVELNGKRDGAVYGGGVSLEYMVLLANTLGSAPWFNMPHRASDEYVRAFAAQVLRSLRPDVRVYVEYSNEVWGTLFPGGRYCEAQGLALGLNANAMTSRFCYAMLRSNQMFNIWRDVWAAAGAADRLEFVLNSQYVNPDVTKQMLACSALLGAHAVYRSVPLIHTAFAIAPYFGTYVPARDKNLEVFLNTTLPAQIAAIGPIAASHAASLSAKGLRLLTYESGLGVQGSGTDDDLAVRAARHVSMRALYVQYYETLRANGVKAMVAYASTDAFSTSRTWGHLESTDQDPQSAPKYLGLLDYIALHSECSADREASIAQSEIALRGFSCSSDSGALSGNNTSSSECSQNGVCVAQDTCECYYGVEGAACETVHYTEHTDLCGYHCGFWQGECVPDYVSGTDRYWKCVCTPPYYGVQCALFTCENNCNGNGQCLDANACHCYAGYTGAFCEKDCGCDGHGMCVDDVWAAAAKGDPWAPLCVCDVGYVWSVTKRQCVADMRLSLPLSSSNGSLSQPALTTTHSAVDNKSESCSLDCAFGQCVREALTAGGVRDRCACWAGYGGALCATPAPHTRTNAHSLVGVNLAGVTYYTIEQPFVDAMKSSSDWVSVFAPGITQASNAYAFGNGQPVHLREEDGYPARLEPGQHLVKMMLRDVHKHVSVAGRYVCLFDGDGEIDFNFDSKVTSIGKRRVEFDFFPTEKVGCTTAYCGDNGILLRLTRTNPLDPVRNIRVVPLGAEKTYMSEPFTATFLSSLRGHTTLRFMEWMSANAPRALDTVWSTRRTPRHASQSGGVSVEHMVDLCNRLGADPWFSLPHNASDEFVRSFARLVRRTLRPDATAYLEYSNEVWNTLFPQGKYAQAEGLRLNLSTNAVSAGNLFHATRSAQIFSIWAEEFARTPGAQYAAKFLLQPNGSTSSSNGTPMGPSLLRVLSTFTISTSTSRAMLGRLHFLGSAADLLGVTGYFDCGVADENNVASLSVEKLHAQCVAGIPGTLSLLDSQRSVAREFNASLVFYEAGQSLVEYRVIAYGNGDNPALTALFLAANRHPGMTDVYVAYLNALVSGGFLSHSLPFMQFVSAGAFSKYGSWGIFEHNGQVLRIEESPKYMALRQFFYYTDPDQMLLRFPSSFQSSVSSSSSTTASTTADSAEAARFKYIKEFLSSIQLNGVVPYEVDTSCAVCVQGESGVGDGGGAGCESEDGAHIAWNGDYLAQGDEFVSLPRRGDVWVAGEPQSVVWTVRPDSAATQPAATVTLRLWKNAFCGLHGAQSLAHRGVLVYEHPQSVSFVSGRCEVTLPAVAASLPLSATQTERVPHGEYDATETYFWEIRGVLYHSLLSEPFAVLPARSRTLLSVSLSPPPLSTPSLSTPALSGCAVSGGAQYRSLSQALLSSHAARVVVPDQGCMSDYAARTLSTKNSSLSLLSARLTSCYTKHSAACRLLRVAPRDKPIMDCVAHLSPFPALALSVSDDTAATTNGVRRVTVAVVNESDPLGWRERAVSVRVSVTPWSAVDIAAYVRASGHGYDALTDVQACTTLNAAQRARSGVRVWLNGTAEVATASAAPVARRLRGP